MTAFEGGWSILKASGPPLNSYSINTPFHNDPYGFQDFRFTDSSNMNAGSFPAILGRSWARHVKRSPEGLPETTLRPIGSNVNLNLVRTLGNPSEAEMIQDISSTGAHEAIHQAMEPILNEMGIPFQNNDEYERLTEWAANLGMFHEKTRAREALRSHPVFEGRDGL